MGAVTEALLTHRAEVGFLSTFVAVIIVESVEGRGGVLEAAFQAGGGGDEVFNV